MLHELSTLQFPSIKALMRGQEDYPVVNAVIDRNAPGRVFVDHFPQPQSAFVLTNAGFSYLIGIPHNERFNQALNGQLKSEIFPAIQTSDDPTLIFYPLSDGWETPLKKFIGKRKVYDLFRKKFIFLNEKFAQHSRWQDLIPTGFSLHPIDQALLEKVGADMAPWESIEDFLSKGFGFWLMKGDEIASECSSVFVGSSAVEINIHTLEKYQKRGFGTITASAFIEECLSRGLRPNWECWWDNEPSQSLAQKLGFEPIYDHPVFLLNLN